MLNVERGVLPATFQALRTCGGGCRECVAYWLGSIDRPHNVDDIVQPAHRAARGWYEVDPRWVTDFFLTLRQTKRTIRAQVHTHPGSSVLHSGTDDNFAIVPSAGFVSIVLPFFATGDVTLDGAHIAELTTGGWTSRSELEAIRWT